MPPIRRGIGGVHGCELCCDKYVSCLSSTGRCTHAEVGDLKVITEGLVDCPLCSPQDESVVWRDDRCRVICVNDPDYSGYCRVIWHKHVREMTDLDSADRRHLMAVVFATEAGLRRLCRPDKVNLASLANQVPHLHWHVIARYRDDRHFPVSIWGSPQRIASRRPAPAVADLAAAILETLAEEHGGGL